MKRIVHTRPHPANRILHIETPLAVVNITVGLTDHRGRRVDSIEILPSNFAGEPQRVRVGGMANVRVVELKAPFAPDALDWRRVTHDPLLKSSGAQIALARGVYVGVVRISDGAGSYRWNWTAHRDAATVLAYLRAAIPHSRTVDLPRTRRAARAAAVRAADAQRAAVLTPRG